MLIAKNSRLRVLMYIVIDFDKHLSGCVLFTSFFSQKLIFNSLPTSFFNPFSPMVIVRGIASKKPFTKPFSAMERQGWMYLSITGRAVKSLTTSYEDFPLTTMWADVRWTQALTTKDSLQQTFPAAIPIHGYIGHSGVPCFCCRIRICSENVVASHQCSHKIICGESKHLLALDLVESSQHHKYTKNMG